MISVIIPTLNEAKSISNCLSSLFSQKGNFEVIIVDAGSKDKTIEKAAKFNVRIVRSKKGRALQMNKGASLAKGNILWFLHADIVVPKNAISKIEAACKKSVGGAFYKKYDKKSFLLSVNVLVSKIRIGVFKSFWGNECIFVRKDVFEKMNGFKEIPIMEDVDFSKRLRKAGNIAVIKEYVVASSRKYLKNGWLSQAFKNMKILFFYYVLSWKPERLAKLY